MESKKKAIIAIITITIIFVIFLVTMINIRAEKIMKEKREILPEIELTSDIFETEDINRLREINLEKDKNVKVSSKYIVGSNSYVVKADVNLENRTGKLIFLRDGYNKANIYQTKYGIDELGSVSSQVAKYMEEFKTYSTMIIGLSSEEPTNEILYDKDDSDKNIPLEESIFNKNKLYSLTYETKDNLLEDDIEDSFNNKKYEINFYRNGSYLMCELVKIF